MCIKKYCLCTPINAGIGITLRCIVIRTAGKGGDLGVPTPGIADMEHDLSGVEGTGAGGGTVSTRYSWADLHASVLDFSSYHK